MIDGKMQESIWDKAAWTDAFVDIEGDAKPAPPLHTRAKIIWDDSCIYILQNGGAASDCNFKKQG